jgi:Ca2+:H+ antiporter
LTAQGQPSYLSSFKWLIFGSWWNVLLLFIPLSILSTKLDWDAALRFSFSFFAIMPLARVRTLMHQVSMS